MFTQSHLQRQKFQIIPLKQKLLKKKLSHLSKKLKFLYSVHFVEQKCLNPEILSSVYYVGKILNNTLIFNFYENIKIKIGKMFEGNMVNI